VESPLPGDRHGGFGERLGNGPGAIPAPRPRFFDTPDGPHLPDGHKPTRSGEHNLRSQLYQDDPPA